MNAVSVPDAGAGPVAGAGVTEVGSSGAVCFRASTIESTIKATPTTTKTPAIARTRAFNGPPPI
jgi:hypothetical protein